MMAKSMTHLMARTLETSTTHDALATLRLFSEDLRPDDVNRIMDIKPDASAARGDGLLRRKDGTLFPARTGTWFVTTKGRVTGQPQDHLSWLVELLHQHLDQVRAQVPDVRVDLSLLVHDHDFQPSDLPHDVLNSAIALGELEIETYNHDWLVTSAEDGRVSITTVV
jgi:uncharacterized protein DUF4279